MTKTHSTLNSSNGQQQKLDKMSFDHICNGTTLAPYLRSDLGFKMLEVSPASLDNFLGIYFEDLLVYDSVIVVAPANLRSRVAFKNHFETMTFDLSQLPDRCSYEVGAQAGWLINTSTCPRELIVKDKGGRSTEQGRMASFDLCFVTRCLGFRPKCKLMPDGMYWIWKRDLRENWLSWDWK
jgi:hypothetical protein